MERIGLKPERPILNKQALARSASQYARVAPEAMRMLTPKPVSRRIYRRSV